MASVYLGSDGTMLHAWCGRPLYYQGMRGGLELDFYCSQCLEHVTLPVHVLPQVPMTERQGLDRAREQRAPSRRAVGPA